MKIYVIVTIFPSGEVKKYANKLAKSKKALNLENVWSLEDLMDANAKHQDVLVYDSYFCEDKLRNKFEDTIKNLIPDVEVEWLYMENNLEACVLEAKKLKATHLLSNLKKISLNYVIPKGAETVKL